jgi:hypothetical protein
VKKNNDWIIECGNLRNIGSSNNDIVDYILMYELTQMCLCQNNIRDVYGVRVMLPECKMMEYLKNTVELEKTGFAYNISCEEFFEDTSIPCVIRSSTKYDSEWIIEPQLSEKITEFFVFSSRNNIKLEFCGDYKKNNVIIGKSEKGMWYIFGRNEDKKIIIPKKSFETFFDLIVTLLNSTNYLKNLYEAITTNWITGNKYRSQKTIEANRRLYNLMEMHKKLPWEYSYKVYEIFQELKKGNRLAI